MVLQLETDLDIAIKEQILLPLETTRGIVYKDNGQLPLVIKPVNVIRRKNLLLLMPTIQIFLQQKGHFM